MNRSTIDRLVSYIGFALAVILLVAGILLTTASTYVRNQVSEQLTSQRITMPQGGAIDSLSAEDKSALQPFAGQAMNNGDQAKAYADHYIAAHMKAMSGGKTYEEVSGEYMKAPDKTTPEAQQLGELRQTLFMGNTLRGLLLNAYAFGTMGKIAGYGALASYIGAAVLALLALLGFRHAAQTAPTVVNNTGRTV